MQGRFCADANRRRIFLGLAAALVALTGHGCAPSDEGAGSAPASSGGGAAPANQAPTANAGPDQTVVSGATVTLAGSGADPDGTIASFAWTQTSGPTVALSTPAAASTVFTAPTATAAVMLGFQLTVTDNRGATASDGVSVTVNPASPVQVSSTTTASITWQSVAGAVDYAVKRGGVLVSLAEDTQNRFREMDLTPGTLYSYTVEALDGSGAVLSVQQMSAATAAGPAQLNAADLPPGGAALARSFTTFGWSPNPLYDTCSKELHDAFWTYGPDNKVYPTWHPPVYQFADGSRCTFGHEHGQDQRQSTLYRVSGAIPFGYVNEQLSPADPTFQRNEDHFGHKVALFNALPAQDRDTGQPLDCDVYFKLHQGTFSPDAFRNNSHERFLHYRCTNGLEVRWKSLQSFGIVNSFTQEISNVIPRSEIATQGAAPANQPVGADRRIIPTRSTIEVTTAPGTFPDSVSQRPDPASGVDDCDNCRGGNGLPAYLARWNIEVWQGGPGATIFSDNTGQGTLVFRFEGGPYWNLANSARYYDPSRDSNPQNSQTYRLGRQIDLCFTPGEPGYGVMDCQLARARSGGVPLAFDDPRSPFNGSVRFNEFNFLGLLNLNAENSRLFTSPYGDFLALENSAPNLRRTRSADAPIRQYFSRTTRMMNVQAANWAGTQSCGGRSGAGACWTDFRLYRMPNGEVIDAGIHAPN